MSDRLHRILIGPNLILYRAEQKTWNALVRRFPSLQEYAFLVWLLALIGYFAAGNALFDVTQDHLVAQIILNVVAGWLALGWLITLIDGYRALWADFQADMQRRDAEHRAAIQQIIDAHQEASRD